MNIKAMGDFIMIKRLRFLLLFFVLGIVRNSFPMWGEGKGSDFFDDVGRIARDLGDDAERGIRHRRQENEINAERRLRVLDEGILNAASPEERLEYVKQKTKLMDDAINRESGWDDLEREVVAFVPKVWSTATDMIHAEHMHQQNLETAAINAEASKEATIENARQYIEALKDPKNAKLAALFTTVVAVGICGAWHGSKLLSNLIQQYLNKIPTIAEETSLVSVKEKIVNFFAGNKLESNVQDVVLEKNLAARVSKIATSVKNTVQNQGFFRHLLFYGPPGTGKTMLAKRIARSSGLEYIYFAGGSALEQLDTKDALSKLTELFEFAKRSSKKLMIIIDEAEVLLADRNKKLKDKTRKLLNLVLGYTGTEQKNFVVVALTNRRKDLDSAFLNRCDIKLEIGVPAPAERLKILELYVNKFLLSRIQSQAKPSFFARIFGAKAVAGKLSVEKDALNKSALEDVAQRLDGFVGRDISKLVIAIQSEAYTSPKGCITKDMVDEVVQQMIDQKTDEINGLNQD